MAWYLRLLQQALLSTPLFVRVKSLSYQLLSYQFRPNVTGEVRQSFHNLCRSHAISDLLRFIKATFYVSWRHRLRDICLNAALLFSKATSGGHTPSSAAPWAPFRGEAFS